MIFRIRYGSSMDCKPEPGETEVVIPESVTEIELCVFQKCKNLITITVPDDARFFQLSKIRPNCCSRECNDHRETHFLYLPKAQGNYHSKRSNRDWKEGFSSYKSLDAITIPRGIRTIAYSSFEGCDHLVEISLPKSVTKIEKCAFQGCRKLRSIAIPREVMTIGEGVFADCKSLDTIFLPNIAIDMDEDAFTGCNTLTFEFV